MFYSDCFTTIDSVATAISILPVALELLFEDCVRACVRFLEAVPWSEDEENRILNLIPLLTCDEEAKELVARVSVSPAKANPSVEMLYGLIYFVTFNYPNTKAFVAKLLRDFASKDVVKAALDMALQSCLLGVKRRLEESRGPYFGGDRNEMMTDGYNLLWLVETMIELRVADSAVKAWSEQAPFAAILESVFRGVELGNIVPGLSAVVLRCTSLLARSAATGNVLAERQVRLKFVRNWLPVWVRCKTTFSSMGSNHKSSFLELEETFLRIVSTLPMSDAQDLLKRWLTFPNPNVGDCPHLVDALYTRFRRANRLPQPDLSR